jgi:phage terminase large subunit GpA-like protein
MLRLAEVNALNLAAAVVHDSLPPAPRLTVSEWADAKRVLSREAAAEPGAWRTDRAPYQREMMDVFTDPMVEAVVYMCASQIGKTEVVNNIVGYFIDQDPSPILVVQPNVDPMARTWSTDRLAPMLRDTECLRGRVSDPKSRDSSNTVLHKVFPGGHITVIGANSPSGLASRPIRVVLFEEIDRYDDSISTEGDPVKLGEQRAANFWNRKILKNSTPTLKGFSRIEKEWERSDQRRYHVPCPSCGEYQLLIWKNLHWEQGQPETAAYRCEHCAVLIPETEKHRMLAAGRWVPENPGSRVPGFHISALYSPWQTWVALAQNWLDSQQDVAALQAFINLKLGETWEERGGGLDPDDLDSRKVAYPCEVPAGVGLLTAGVDVQDDRLEVIVRGWGHGEESWLIKREIILGDPSGDAKGKGKKTVWAQLDELLKRPWKHESGATLQIDTTCVDSGAHTDAVYRFCKPRYGFRVFATKGYSGPAHPIVNHKPSTNNRMRVRLFFVGTDAAKDSIYGRLKTAAKGPRYMHFPLEADEDYFDQLVSEKVVKELINGRWRRSYKLPRGKRNEVLDCEVLTLVALELASVRKEHLGEAARRLGGQPPPPPPPAPARTLAQEKLESIRRRGPKKRPWVNGWK